MELRVLSGISAIDSDRVLSLADQVIADCAAAGQETAQLDQGLAIFSPGCPDIPETNRLCFASLPSEQDVEDWFESVAHFYQTRCTCLRWITPVRSFPISEQSALVRLLRGKGWKQMALNILRLNHAISPDPTRDQIVSARAVMRLYEPFVFTLYRTESPRRAEVAIRKLDDPRYDVLVVIRQRQIVAQAGLMISGEIGLIEQVDSIDQHQDGLLRKIIMGSIIDLCIRAQLKHVFTTVDPQNSTVEQFYTDLGFAKIGNEVSFISPDPSRDR